MRGVVHRDISHISYRTVAAKIACRASSLRVHQNLAIVDEGTYVLDRRAADFATWTAALQPNPTKALSGQPRRMARLHAWQMMYRADAESLRGWGQLEMVMRVVLPV